MGAGFQFHKMKRALEMDGDDGCTIIWKYFMPLNCQKKETWLKRLNFMLYTYIYMLPQVKYFHVLRILPSLGHDLGGFGWKMKMQLSLQSTWGQL